MIDISLTNRLAQLSKLSFNERELDGMTQQMTDIIQLMDKLREFDLSDEEHRHSPQKYENLRQDTIGESCERELILKNSENVSGNSFSVPKVV